VADLARTASNLGTAMRQFEQELATIIELFEKAGGRSALLAIIAQARRLEATSATQEDVQALISWLPTACRMLETELLLVDMLSSQASHAPR